MAAFKMLDQENNGYIDLQILKNSLEKDGIEFKEDEIESFVAFATNGDEKYILVKMEVRLLSIMKIISVDWTKWSKNREIQLWRTLVTLWCLRMCDGL